MSATAIILTCQRDEQFSDMLRDAIEVMWPGVMPVVLVDTDRSTETDIPGDIRDVVRRVPYLRKVFDAWHLSPTEDVYILDADCLLYSEPVDFPVAAYQGASGAVDDPRGVKIWNDLGVDFETVDPRFVGGMFSAHKSMWADNLELSYEYVRECVKRGLDREKYPGVVCEQSLQAGLWRKTYPDNRLSFDRYPINHLTPNAVLWHISSSKATPVTELLLATYKQRSA